MGKPCWQRVARPASWYQVHDWEGLFLGVFLRMDDLEGWISRREPTTRFRVLLFIGETLNDRWSVRATAAGDVQWCRKKAKK